MSIWSSRLHFHFDGRSYHCLDDVLVAGAAAQIGGQNVDQFFFTQVRPLLQHTYRKHQEARSTKAALLGMVAHEGLLHGVQSSVPLQSLDSPNISSLCLHRKHQA